MPMPQRVKGAAFGFGITMAPIVVIACMQFLFVPYTVALVSTDPEHVAWAVPSLPAILVNIHAVVALIIAAHWLFVAIVGGGQFLRIRSANIVLALSGLHFALFMVEWSGAGMPSYELLKGLCPGLDLSNGVANVGWHVPRCRARDILGNVLLLGPIILLIASAILRIIVSRRLDDAGAASAVHPDLS